MATDATNPNLAKSSLPHRRKDLMDTLTTLRDITDGAETTNAVEPAIALRVESLDKTALWIKSTGSSGTVDGSNYWTVTVEAAATDAFTNATEVHAQVLAAGEAEYYVALDGYMLETIRTAGEAESLYIRSKLTETGTTATDATYGAYITTC